MVIRIRNHNRLAQQRRRLRLKALNEKEKVRIFGEKNWTASINLLKKLCAGEYKDCINQKHEQLLNMLNELPILFKK